MCYTVAVNTSESTPLNSLLAIFNIATKSELSEHCRSTVIDSSDLANLIYACMIDAIPIQHFRFHKHHYPEQTIPAVSEHEALVRNGVGPLSREAKKFANKIDQMFAQRRLFNGHMFIPRNHPTDWHLFYFDQRDVDPHNNHWGQGEHIHLMSMLTHPQMNVLDLAEKIESETRPKLSGGFHIRYKR